MKIVCTRENLLNGLSLIGGIATKNINLPILNNVLIKANKQKVSLISTNLEQAITAQLRSKIDEDGTFTVPSKTLSDFVGLLSEETVEMAVKGNELILSSDKTSTKIKGTSAEDFPILPEINDGKGYLVNIDNFKKSLQQVISSAAKNDIRPELAGVLMHFNPEGFKGLIMAATDSYRLAEKKLELDQGDETVQIIVPVRTAQEMMRVLTINKNIGANEKTVRLVVSENQIIMRNNDVELISRLVQGKYPDYTQIIPTNFKTTVVFDADKLVKDIKAASLFTTFGVNAVNFKADSKKGSVEISSASAQAGEHRSNLSVDVAGEENSIILNHRYLLEGLGNINSEKINLKIINGDSPCLLSADGDEDYKYIIMPIRQ